MNMKLTKRFAVVLLAAGCLVGFAMSGCKSKESKVQNRTLHGTIEIIDLEENKLTMSWFNEKMGKQMQIIGQALPDTEIYIDGKVASIDQLKEGDEVVVDGYQEKNKGVFAKRITVTRNSAGTMTKIEKPTATSKTAEEK
jgi:Cu/Ag efflux protein CusF